MQERDGRKRQRRRHAVNGDDALDPGRGKRSREQTRERRLPDPAESDAGCGNSELGCGDRVAEPLNRGRDGARAASALGHPQPDLAATHRHQSELRGDEVGIGEDEREHRDEAERVKRESWLCHPLRPQVPSAGPVPR